MCFAMPMSMARIVLVVLAATLGMGVGGCSDSGPTRANIDAVYRFENLRTPLRDAKGSSTGPDEWSPVLKVLEDACGKSVKVYRSGVRSLGTMEVATYEARCTLPKFETLTTIESELEALGVAGGRDRVETYLCQVNSTYKSNFVQAAVNMTISGVSVSGNRIRIYGAPGEPPAETTAGYGGVWTVRLSVVPETKFVYGLSEDPTGKIPTRYFRMNVATRQQDRMEEAEFLKMFPKAAPGAPKDSPKAAEKGAPGKAPR